MGSETLAILMFPTMIVLLIIGVPVAFALLATSFIFGWTIYGPLVGLQLYNGVSTTASQFLLSAIPGFILMGCVLERSGIAARLFRGVHLWLGGLPGGIALTTMAMATLIAATTGIVGAVEVMIGVMSVPMMKKLGYRDDLITGTVCAGGSLGTMIPPSLILVIYASVANMSVGKLFTAAMLPGALMVALFLGYIFLRCLIQPPEPDPEAEAERRQTGLGEKLWISVTGFAPALILIFAVLGTIILGIATPTEAASVGAAGAVALSFLYGSFTWAMMRDSLYATLRITCMIMLIVVGGSMFSAVFRILGGNGVVEDIMAASPLGPEFVVLIPLVIVFVAGFLLDWVSVVLICLPIFLPALSGFDVDPVWFAMLVFVVLQTSYLTPPMAPSIFYFKGIAPPGMTTRSMYLGVLPFIACQLIVLVSLFLFPGLATWLPSVLVTGF